MKRRYIYSIVILFFVILSFPNFVFSGYMVNCTSNVVQYYPPANWAYDNSSGTGIWYGDDEMYADISNSFCTITFTGVGLELDTWTSSSYKPLAIYIDRSTTYISNDFNNTNADLYLPMNNPPSPSWPTNIYLTAVSNLSYGTHTIGLKWTMNAPGNYCEVIAFKVWEPTYPQKNLDAPATNSIYPMTNAIAANFAMGDHQTNNVHTVIVSNIGTAPALSIAKVKLYQDTDSSGNISGSDVLLGVSTNPMNNKWTFTNLNISPWELVSSYYTHLLTVDFSQTASGGETFQAVILADIRSQSITNANAVRVIYMPTMGSLSASPDSIVTNNNADTITFVASITDKGDGVVPIMDLSPIGNSSSYTMKSIGANQYAISNITVPTNINGGTNIVKLYAYPTNNLFTSYVSNSISVSIFTYDPPAIGSISYSPVPATNNGQTNVSFTTTITDKLGGTGAVYIDLSPIGNSSTTTLYHTTGNTYKVSNIAIPTSVSISNYTLTLYAYNCNNTKFNTKTVLVQVTGNNVPIANAGPDQVVKADELVLLYGSGSDADGDTLTYKWYQVSGPTISSFSKNSNSSASNTSFTAPQVYTESTIVINLIVNDGKADSAPDSVTITVQPLEEPSSNLDNAYIYPNPLTPNNDLVIRNVPKSHITAKIYDLRGVLVHTFTTDVEVANNNAIFNGGFGELGLASGIYIVIITDDIGSPAKKLKLIYTR